VLSPVVPHNSSPGSGHGTEVIKGFAQGLTGRLVHKFLFGVMTGVFVQYSSNFHCGLDPRGTRGTGRLVAL
jgi:hypothetical protein